MKINRFIPLTLTGWLALGLALTVLALSVGLFFSDHIQG